jgi:glucose/arabinose dehydrogenase
VKAPEVTSKPGAIVPKEISPSLQRPTESAKEQASSKKSKVVDLSHRFTTRDGFAVQQLIANDLTGSLITSSFNEFGQLLVGRENGPLMIAEDTDGDGNLDQVRSYCDKVKNCQGILALSGMVFVVAEGSDGAGLYRLSDEDRDGELEEAMLLVAFDVTSKEHGPHGIVLGPDGKLYITVGNHAKIEEKFSQHSPRRHLYEGDLIPKYEDPGHFETERNLPPASFGRQCTRTGTG